MIIRIPLDEFNSSKSFVYPDQGNQPDQSNPNGQPDQTDPDQTDPDQSDTGQTDFSDFSLPEPRFFMTDVVPEDYRYSRYEYPAVAINVTVPDDDRPVVASWLGNSSSSGLVASDTFIKRMTAAVISAYTALVTAASRLSLFTSPFRIGIALRRRNGSYVAVTAPQLILPNSMAPLMPLRESAPVNDSLTSMTEIRLMPRRLTMSLQALDIPAALLAESVAVDVFATRQTSLLAGDESVTSIRSYSIDGSAVPCWYYKRLAEDIVRAKAEQEKDFRIIASLPVAEAVKGIALTLPQSVADLNDWSTLEKFDKDAGGSQGGGNQEEPETPPAEAVGAMVRTEPLDLGLPELRKRIRGLTVRGIFPRRKSGEATSDTTDSGEEEIRVTLYGSHHRESWRRIAVSRGAHIRLLRSLRYRWYKVEIEGPADAIYDALTFEISK